jgi:hypothetical protein
LFFFSLSSWKARKVIINHSTQENQRQGIFTDYTGTHYIVISCKIYIQPFHYQKLENKTQTRQIKTSMLKSALSFIHEISRMPGNSCVPIWWHVPIISCQLQHDKKHYKNRGQRDERDKKHPWASKSLIHRNTRNNPHKHFFLPRPYEIQIQKSNHLIRPKQKPYPRQRYFHPFHVQK